MASKEATVYIVDCGSTMGERSNGRPHTNLDWALEYVWDKITTTVATGRKTALAGVVGLRTDETRNILESEKDYAHITVHQEIGQIQMPQVRKLRQELVVSSTEAGDAISALVIAIQMIVETCKKLQYIRRIVLVTDARGSMQAEADDLGNIVNKLKGDNIELLVLGVDFDDADYGFKEEGKSEVKAGNEAMLKQLCDDCNGTFGTLMQAVDELGIPRVKSTRPVAGYKGYLTLGNVEEYDSGLAIDIERYPKIMEAKPPSASKFVTRSDMAVGEATQSTTTLDGDDTVQSTNDGLAAVKTARTYQVGDESAAGGKRDVSLDELAKGYEYGRTAVHMSESDQNVTMYETKAGLDIIGFVDKNHYERYLDMSRSSLIVSQRTNDKASMALSSLIHSLYELESYAIARLVAKENKEPRILLLAPNIEPDFESLYDVELPFAEDLRGYKFPPLDRVVTVSGKVLRTHRNLPSDDLQTAMDDYVDRMDLSTFGKDDDGEPSEYMPIDETYSPMLHRINQVIKHRAIYPETPPPPPYETLTRYSRPPSNLLQTAQPALERVIAAADVKKVPPKARGKRYGRNKDTPKPLSDLDVGALLAQQRQSQTRTIDPRNAIPEFKQLLANATDLEQTHDACRQLGAIVRDWVRHSVGEAGYGRAVEGMRVMREEMVEMEEAGAWNGFLRGFKADLLGGELGGERREMWFRVRANRLGLIGRKEGGGSEVEEEEARAFMSFS